MLEYWLASSPEFCGSFENVKYQFDAAPFVNGNEPRML